MEFAASGANEHIITVNRDLVDVSFWAGFKQFHGPGLLGIRPAILKKVRQPVGKGVAGDIYPRIKGVSGKRVRFSTCTIYGHYTSRLGCTDPNATQVISPTRNGSWSNLWFPSRSPADYRPNTPGG